MESGILGTFIHIIEIKKTQKLNWINYCFVNQSCLYLNHFLKADSDRFRHL